ncbi:universal stress protein [Natrinema sp. 1APR25-10V2]|uniref:universal stress protein n=1 Tax=Natrinema sp. 1APR25-10V2 TaxID=2951081 RepID=UPI00287630B0|nr:universal stress protein [Natrinema sp. 1APR25-10V2]MDS0475218.1 universal stress protein [Natrinema sp. 1APR25-10V2]
MYQIVIPIDTDEERAMHAVDYVTDLVAADGPIDDPDELAVTVVNVFEKFTAVDEGSRVTSDELYDPDSVPEAVTTVRDELEDIGIDIEVVRRHGDPADEIIAYADSVDADVLVLPTRKRSPVGKAVFGSVTQEVILETDRPVTVV